MHTITSPPALTRAIVAFVFQRRWHGERPSGGTGRLLNVLLVWQGRASQRWALEQLDDRLLEDVGLSRDDAAREAAKPSWRP
jgi:uncharacterized protein YjiS (DUF1127 family)